MERLEIESASSDASSKILASWPADLREHQPAPAFPARGSHVNTQSSSGKAALSLADNTAVDAPAQQYTKMGKGRVLEALIQPGMQAHIQVTFNMQHSVQPDGIEDNCA